MWSTTIYLFGTGGGPSMFLLAGYAKDYVKSTGIDSTRMWFFSWHAVVLLVMIRFPKEEPWPALTKSGSENGLCTLKWPSDDRGNYDSPVDLCFLSKFRLLDKPILTRPGAVPRCALVPNVNAVARKNDQGIRWEYHAHWSMCHSLWLSHV